MKLTINRPNWLRGEEGYRSALVRKSDGKMCCVGFFGLACGIPREAMLDISTPAQTVRNNESIKWPEGTLVDLGGSDGRKISWNSQVMDELFGYNDDPRHPEDMREQLIAGGFKQLGVEVEFTDDPMFPEWMTPEQVTAVQRKYAINPDGSLTLGEFFARVQNYGDYAGMQWCGMFLGIEKDGYTHS